MTTIPKFLKRGLVNNIPTGIEMAIEIAKAITTIKI